MNTVARAVLAGHRPSPFSPNSVSFFHSTPVLERKWRNYGHSRLDTTGADNRKENLKKHDVLRHILLAVKYFLVAGLPDRELGQAYAQNMFDYSLKSVYFGGGNWKGRQGRREGGVKQINRGNGSSGGGIKCFNYREIRHRQSDCKKAIAKKTLFVENEDCEDDIAEFSRDLEYDEEAADKVLLEGDVGTTLLVRHLT
ncbi:hypothetical protein ZIOFF_033760 [Zingiber officinale]|uniref:Uncharacterized protein n=1 Tax=Zingiber officinale TaxID=94328 RepID=A0A8J5LCG4_ZINOF|nr:hypothetical protein ZIOFF_033760 [Zingiber officinale]